MSKVSKYLLPLSQQSTALLGHITAFPHQSSTLPYFLCLSFNPCTALFVIAIASIKHSEQIKHQSASASSWKYFSIVLMLMLKLKPIYRPIQRFEELLIVGYVVLQQDILPSYSSCTQPIVLGAFALKHLMHRMVLFSKFII